MSFTKRLIDDEMQKGNDVLADSEHDANYAEWCYYSNLPSPKAYENE